MPLKSRLPYPFLSFFELLLLVCGPIGLVAQQLPLYSQYRNANGLINPGSVHNEYFLHEFDLNVTASYRGLWIGQNESPRTLQVQGEYVTDLGGVFELVTGINALLDQTGPLGLSGYYGRIGVAFSRDPYYEALVLGFSAGMVNYQFDASEIRWANEQDPSIPLLNESFSRPDLGVGIFYHRRLGKKSRVSRNQIYAGFSVPQLLNTRYRLTTTDNEATAIAIERDLHFYFTGGWYHFFNQDAFIEISTWAKYVNGAPFNLDLNVRLQPSPAFWAGVGYNSSQAIHLEAGLNIADYLGTDSNLQIGFSCDGSFKAFNYDLGPTYEFLVATQLATR